MSLKGAKISINDMDENNFIAKFDQFKDKLGSPIYLKIKKYFSNILKGTNMTVPIAIILNQNTLLEAKSLPKHLKDYFVFQNSWNLHFTLSLHGALNFKEVMATFYNQLDDLIPSKALSKIYAHKSVPFTFDKFYEIIAASIPQKDDISRVVITLTIQTNLHTVDQQRAILKDFLHCLLKPQNFTLNFCINVLTDFYDLSGKEQLFSTLLDVFEPSNFDDWPIPSINGGRELGGGAGKLTFVTKHFSFPSKEESFGSFILYTGLDSFDGRHHPDINRNGGVGGGFDPQITKPGPNLLNALGRSYFREHTASVATLWRPFRYASSIERYRKILVKDRPTRAGPRLHVSLDAYLGKLYARAGTTLTEPQRSPPKTILRVGSESSVNLDDGGIKKLISGVKRKLRSGLRGKDPPKDRPEEADPTDDSLLDQIRASSPSFRLHVEGIPDVEERNALLTDRDAMDRYLMRCTVDVLEYRARLPPCLSILESFCKTFAPDASQRSINLSTLYTQTLNGTLRKNAGLLNAINAFNGSPGLTTTQMLKFVGDSLVTIDTYSNRCSICSIRLEKMKNILRLCVDTYTGCAPKADDRKDDSSNDSKTNGDLPNENFTDRLVYDISHLVDTFLKDHLTPINRLTFHELFYLDAVGQGEMFRTLYPSPPTDITQSFERIIDYQQNSKRAAPELESRHLNTALVYNTAINDANTTFYTRKIKLIDWYAAFESSVRDVTHSSGLEDKSVSKDLSDGTVESFKQALLDLKHMGLAKPRRSGCRAENSSRYWDVVIINYPRT